MTLSLTCACGALLEVDDKFAGHTIHCPDCNRPINTAPPVPNPPFTSGLALASMLLALVGNLYPVPEGPYGKLPYIYLAYMAAVLLWFAFSPRARSAAREEVSSDA